MIIKPNALAEQMSGKLGKAAVFYMNQQRQCGRVYSLPTNPNSEAQLLNREQQAATSKIWSTMTKVQLKTWNDAASYLKIKAKTRLGTEITMSGYQLFVRSAYAKFLETGLKTSAYFAPSTQTGLPAFTITATLTAATGIVVNYTRNTTMQVPKATLMLYFQPRATDAQKEARAKAKMVLHKSFDKFFAGNILSSDTTKAVTVLNAVAQPSWLTTGQKVSVFYKLVDPGNGAETAQGFVDTVVV